MIERFNRTQKGLLSKAFLVEGNSKWLQILPDIMTNYNSVIHDTTGFTPLEALDPVNRDAINKNIDKSKVVDNFQGEPLQVGDRVRLLIDKNESFKKGVVNWTSEIFKVVRVTKPKNPNTPLKYKVASEKDDEVLRGFLTRAELQKIDKVENKRKLEGQEAYTVEKFLEKRKHKNRI